MMCRLSPCQLGPLNAQSFVKKLVVDIEPLSDDSNAQN